MPVDWVSLAAVIMGTLIVLVPVAGITLRFALKPVSEAVVAMRATRGTDRQIDLLEKRVAYLEQQNSHLEEQVEQLAEVVDFHRRLDAGPEA